MKQRLICPLSVLLLLLMAGIGSATELQLDVKKQTLANGMKILVLENHSAPVFSAIIKFRTGSVDERPGITGISHLLEHMLFKGTKITGTTDFAAEIPIMNKVDSLAHLMRAEQLKFQSPTFATDSTQYKALKQQIADLYNLQRKYIIKDELWETFLENGGTSLNASTGNDVTQYYVSLPKNRLELWAFLESDRLENLILREFYSERDVVMEERRLSENSPWGRMYEALGGTIYWATPYKWPVLGWMSDLQTVTREDVEAYFKSHYSPSNAVAAIVGNVDAEKVFELCKRYFEKIPAQPLPPPVVSTDAPQNGERRTELEMDANPTATIAWKTPAVGHPDLPALDIAASILSSGRTSRFHKNIREKGLGTASASADNAPRCSGTFSCSVTPFSGHTVMEMEEAVYAEIERLKTEKVSEQELQKIFSKLDVSFIESLRSNRGMAFRLSQSETQVGDWSQFIKYQESLKKVTADDIMRVANQYLTRKNRSVVFITKSSSPNASPRRGKTS